MKLSFVCLLCSLLTGELVTGGCQGDDGLQQPDGGGGPLEELGAGTGAQPGETRQAAHQYRVQVTVGGTQEARGKRKSGQCRNTNI